MAFVNKMNIEERLNQKIIANIKENNMNKMYSKFLTLRKHS